MPVDVDASTPARVTGMTAVTTATFDPPAGLLIACTSGDTSATGQTTPTATITNNGTALTWTEIARRSLADAGGLNALAIAHVAVLSSGRSNMTVTATENYAQDISLKLYVVTGGDTADPIGDVQEGSSESTPVTTTNMTNELASSLGFLAVTEWNATGAPVSDDITIDGFHVAFNVSGGSGYRRLGGAGTTERFQFAGIGGTPAFNWVTFEVRPAAGSGYNPPTDIPPFRAVDPASLNLLVVAVGTKPDSGG